MNTDIKYAVIVDPYSSGNMYADEFKRAGFEVIAVLSNGKPPDVYEQSYRPNDFAIVIRELNNFDEIVNILTRYKPVCVVPGCESGVILSDELSYRLVPNLSNTFAKRLARRHKGKMADAVAAAGIPAIKQIYSNDRKLLRSWIAELKSEKIVIKPPMSASSDGVTLVNKENWELPFNSMIGKKNKLHNVNDTLLVQEYVTGTEYVVDTFSYEGIHTINSISRYNKISDGSFFAIYDYLEWVSENDPVCEEIVQYAIDVLDAVGIKFGPAHIEIMKTENGPRLIEIAARPHGGGNPEYSEIATGDSQIKRVVQYLSGSGEIPKSYKRRKCVRIIFMMCKSNGVFFDEKTFQKTLSLKSYHKNILNIEPGEKLEKTKDLFSSLALGFIVLVHDQPQQIACDYEAYRRIEEMTYV